MFSLFSLGHLQGEEGEGRTFFLPIFILLGNSGGGYLLGCSTFGIAGLRRLPLPSTFSCTCLVPCPYLTSRFPFHYPSGGLEMPLLNLFPSRLASDFFLISAPSAVCLHAEQQARRVARSVSAYATSARLARIAATGALLHCKLAHAQFLAAAALYMQRRAVALLFNLVAETLCARYCLCRCITCGGFLSLPL